MRILGIDSSAKPASVAVAEDGKLLGEFYVNTQQTHSQTLLPMAEALLSSLGLSCHDIDRVAVTNGPGSFTGIRIGVGCVKGVSFQDDIPCCGISTLEAIAYGGIICQGNILCAVMDARCGQVYNALFEAREGGLLRLTEDRAISISDLEAECRQYGERLLLLGDGAALCYKMFSAWGARIAPESLRFQRAANVALLGNGKPAVSADMLQPVYLRMPQAERELKAKREKESRKDMES